MPPLDSAFDAHDAERRRTADTLPVGANSCSENVLLRYQVTRR